MGSTHVSTGVLAGVLTAGAAQAAGVLTPGADVVAWVAVAGGAALLPDWDKPGTSVARMWGPVTDVIARGIGAVSGGHRMGTHDAVLGPAGFALATGVLAWHGLGTPPTDTLTAQGTHPVVAALSTLLWLTPGFVVAATFGLLIMAYTRGIIRTKARTRILVNAVVSVGLAVWYLTAAGDIPPWLPVAVWVGALTGIAGDALTRDGVPVPLVWIWTRSARIRITRMRTGGVLEKRVVAPLVQAVTVLSALYVTGTIQPIIDTARRVMA